MEGIKQGQDGATYSESEGYIADDETRPGSTAIDNHVHGGVRMRGGAEKPTTIEKIKEKFWQAENHVKGKEPSSVEDPHPELAYMSQEEKPGFFSRMGHHQQQHEKEETRNAHHMELNQGAQPAPEMQAANNNGVGGSELGTGYEEDGEETINPAIVPEYDRGVKPPHEVQAVEKGFGTSEVGTGYEEGSEGSVSHVGDLSDSSFKEGKQAASESETASEDDSHRKLRVSTRVL